MAIRQRLRFGCSRRPEPTDMALNKIHRIINRHNLIWEYPTKSFQTQAGRRWLEERELPEIDRLEMDMLLDEWKTCDKQIAKVDEKIAERASHIEAGKILSPTQILMTAWCELLQRANLGQPNRSG